MTNYESAAASSVQRLKERHVKELEDMIEKAYSNTQGMKYTLSMELMQVRAQERLMFQVRQLERAEEYKRQGDQMET